MSVIERYRDLINSAQRHAHSLGAKLELEAVPEERQYPIVFRLTTRPTAAAEGPYESLLFLFVPGESMFTSDVLADVVRRIRQSNLGRYSHLILFSEEDLRIVKRTLEASGLCKFAQAHSYAYHGGIFRSDWIASPSLGPVADQAAYNQPPAEPGGR